jgi:hypothetical protein
VRSRSIATNQRSAESDYSNKVLSTSPTALSLLFLYLYEISLSLSSSS